MNLNQRKIRDRSLLLPLLLLGVAGDAPSAMAQAPGTFTAAGFMIAPRAGHTATLLPNGQVLLAGGINFGFPNFGFPSSAQIWLSAELYDPVTGAFHAAANMTTERWLHTATLLPGGKVLIAGGASAAGSALASAELYDPSTGAFTATGNMHHARSRHTATLLNNGEVLIAGGVPSGSIDSSLASAELYDPLTGAFTSTGDMNRARSAHTATLLCDGRVLMDGSNPDSDVDGSEVYEPQAGAFDSVITTRYGGAETATLLMDGKVLVTRSVEGTPGAVLYDASTGTFSPADGMGGTFRNQFTATLLPDRTILMAGGSLSGDALLYDPTTGTFVPSASMDAFCRRWHTATLLPDGTVLIAGGYATPPVSLYTAQLYKPIVLTPAPRLYSLSGDGRGQGSILHAGTPQIVSSENPATEGEALEIYCGGMNDGSVIPPQVAIGGRMAEVLFFGNASGFAGLNQVNVRVPSGVIAGPAVAVRLMYLGRSSNEVTIGVR